MPSTYDPTTTPGRVRLLISDVGGADGATFLFTDDEINAFLSVVSENVFMAAATALRTIASNEAQVSKAITFLELKTNGPAVADALDELATKYELQADNESEFQLVEIGADFFSRRQLRIQAVQGEGESS